MRIRSRSFGAKGRNQRKQGGRAGVRLVISITPAVLSPAYRFLLVQFKTNKLCIGENLIILIES